MDKFAKFIFSGKDSDSERDSDHSEEVVQEDNKPKHTMAPPEGNEKEDEIQIAKRAIVAAKKTVT